jgi:hypothetical protein
MMIERGRSFSVIILAVVSPSGFAFDVENHWLSMISTMRSEPKGF